MDPNIPPSFYGLPCETIYIKSYDKIYTVPLHIYKSAVAYTFSNTMSYGHSIEAEIDGQQYNIAETVIMIMHYTAMEYILIPYKNFVITQSNLCSMLAVVSWCGAMLKPSRVLDNLREAIKKYIEKTMYTIKIIIGSLVCSLPTKIEILSNAGLMNVNPHTQRYLSHGTYMTEQDMRVVINDIESAQNIIKHHKKICSNFLQIPGFNYGHAEILSSIIDNVNQLIDESIAPKMMISHVFMYGLVDALEAEYEE